MRKIDDKGLIKMMKEEYVSHLRGLISEINVFDSRGKMIIGQDLKVLHKSSGYEYTVDKVSGKDGTAQVTLRTPETPRPSTTDVTKIVPKEVGAEIQADREAKELADQAAHDIIGMENETDDEKPDEKEDTVDRGKKAYPKTPSKPDEGERIFVVDQAAFEKEYEEA
jgi:hypothetical protein